MHGVFGSGGRPVGPGPSAARWRNGTVGLPSTRREKMKVVTIIKYVFTLVGVGMLIGASFLYKNTSAFIHEATRAEGIVVDLLPSHSSNDTSYTYRPVVHFTDQSGETIEFASSVSSNPPSYEKGEKVDVLYRPEEPRNARIYGFFSLWGGAVIVAGIGGVFFLIGAAIMLVIRLKGRKDEYLRTNGMPIDTTLQRVELNESLSVNGRHPFRIATQ
jgi:hypothetical protein